MMAETGRNENSLIPADNLGAVVAEHRLELPVDHEDFLCFVDDHHAVGGCFQQSAEFCLALPQRGVHPLFLDCTPDLDHHLICLIRFFHIGEGPTVDRLYGRIGCGVAGEDDNRCGRMIGPDPGEQVKSGNVRKFEGEEYQVNGVFPKNSEPLRSVTGCMGFIPLGPQDIYEVLPQVRIIVDD